MLKLDDSIGSDDLIGDKLEGNDSTKKNSKSTSYAFIMFENTPLTVLKTIKYFSESLMILKRLSQTRTPPYCYTTIIS